MAQIDSLVDELERSYAEAQERMYDPAVYSDRNAAAEVGRRLKELEGPHKLALEWREAREDADAARSDADLPRAPAGDRGAARSSSRRT